MDKFVKELEITQNSIARYDQNGMTIKNWCITTWGAANIYGFEHNNLLIISLAPYLVLCFFVVEWIYRVYQSRFIRHAQYLEQCMNDGTENEHTYCISAIAGAKTKGEMLAVLKMPHFVTLYIMLLAGSVIALLLKA